MRLSDRLSSSGHLHVRDRPWPRVRLTGTPRKVPGTQRGQPVTHECDRRLWGKTFSVARKAAARDCVSPPCVTPRSRGAAARALDVHLRSPQGRYPPRIGDNRPTGATPVPPSLRRRRMRTPNATPFAGCCEISPSPIVQMHTNRPQLTTTRLRSRITRCRPVRSPPHAYLRVDLLTFIECPMHLCQTSTSALARPCRWLRHQVRERSGEASPDEH